jgi:hypothetical protein
MLLYILLFIVILFVVFKKNSNMEGFEEDKLKNDKKCLLVYYGGSFREGNIGSTTTDTDYGYEAQKNASITHAKLKRVLNKKGFQTDIIINTRHTDYKKELMKWYNPFDIIINNIPLKLHGKDYMIQSAIKNIDKLNKQDYDFILFIRIDLFLKPEFYNVLNTESDKINFLANNYSPKNCNNKQKGSPEIVDLFIFIPKKYYYILDNKFNLNHDSWSYYKKNYKLSDSDMAFMSDMMFDSNSSIDKNPFYVMSSRDENKVIHRNFDIKTKKCEGYKEKNQSYLNNPTHYYLNDNKSFYS